MFQIIEVLPFVASAILAVTVLTSVGSIVSRRFKFSYVYFSILSVAVYILLGYFVSSISNLSTALLAGLVVGFYDATVCWKISILLKANLGLPEEELAKITVSKSLTVMLFVAPFFVFIGHLLK